MTTHHPCGHHGCPNPTKLHFLYHEGGGEVKGYENDCQQVMFGHFPFSWIKYMSTKLVMNSHKGQLGKVNLV